jgi:hypothetical protein
MKISLGKRTLWTSLLLSFGTVALAAPLQRADVAAEPGWVLHVDCDALRPAAVGQYLLAEMDKPESQGKLAAFQTLFSFDPRKQLHGLTLYNAGSVQEDGVMLVYADFDPERLVMLAKAAKESQSTTNRTHIIYSWADDKKQPKDGVMPRTYAAIYGTRVVVFAQREKPVAQALNVLDKATPNLSAGKVFPQLGAAGSNGFIQASARKLDISDSTPNAAVLRLAKLMNLQVGEANQKVTATLSVETSDEAVAKQAATVVQGLLAFAKLQTEKPAGKLAEALLLKQDGSNLVATLVMPAADVIGLLKANAEKKDQPKAEKN